MKSIILLFLGILLGNQLIAQLYPAETRVDSVQFTVIEQNGIMAVDADGVLNQGKYPDIKAIRLTDADLVLDYSFSGKSKRFSPDALKINQLILPGGLVEVPFRGEEYSPPYSLEKKTKVEGQRIWMNLGDQTLDLGEEYTLVIERSIMINVDCEQDRPVFGLQQQWPHYAIALGAGGSIALGQYFNTQKKEKYEAYKLLWQEGADSGDNVFAEAELMEKRAKGFTYGGLILIGLDAAVFINRWLTIKDKQAAFDEFCDQEDVSLQIYPGLEQATGFNGTYSYSAIQFQITF